MSKSSRWKVKRPIGQSYLIHLRSFMFDAPTDFLPVCRYDRSPETVHFLLRLLPSEEPIGTIRVYPLRASDSSSTPIEIHGKDASHAHLTYPTFGLGELCVLHQYRKHKFGHRLVQWAHAYIRDRLLASKAYSEAVDQDKILGEFIIHAQVQARGFYEKSACDSRYIDPS